MNGPFTRDVSKLDSVAQAVVKMREKPIEQIDELSKKTLHSYVHKARERDAGYARSQAGHSLQGGHWDKVKAINKKREKGYGHIARAERKIKAQEETEQLDELSKKTLKSYKKQALGTSYDRLQRQADSAYISGDHIGVDKTQKKMKNRYYGHKAATEKLKNK